MEELNIKEIFEMFWSKKVHIIVILILAIIIGLIYTFKLVTPLYKSSTTLILGRINSSEENSTIMVDNKQITQSEIFINSNLVSTYSQLVESESLIKEVIENLNIDLTEEELRKNVSVSRVANTELIEITVTNADSNVASDVANEIAKVFGEKIEKIYNLNNIYIVDKATPGSAPYNINHIKDIIVFEIFGFIFSVIYTILYLFLDTTIKSSNDIEKIVNVKNLISIPYTKKSNLELVTFEDSKSIAAETFRTLRTNVQFSSISDKKTKTYLITSCIQSEGKSYIVANLAVTFAQAGKKVILIDSDMRRGRQAKIFNVPNESGLSNYISNIDFNGMEINYDINKFIKETSIKNLNIITSGNIPPNPAELLASPKVSNLINDLKTYYDVIIFDGAPILSITDSLILTSLLDSTILVTRYNRTKKDDLEKAKVSIENVGGKIIGTCLNEVPIKFGKNNLNYYYADVEEKLLLDKIKVNLKNLKDKIERIFENKIKSKVNIKREPILVKSTVVSNNYAKGDIVSSQLKSNEEIDLVKKENKEKIKIEHFKIEKRKIEKVKKLKQIKLEKAKKEMDQIKQLEKIRIEQMKKEEERNKLEQKKEVEEKQRLEQEKRVEETQRIEKLKLEEQRRIEEVRKVEKLKQEEAKKKIEEQKRIEKLKIIENRNKKIKEKLNNLNQNLIKLKDKIVKLREFKTEKKLKAIEEAKQRTAKLAKEREEKNKFFGRRIMFEIDSDEGDI